MKNVTAIISTKGFCSVSNEQKLLVQDDFGRATAAQIREFWKDIGTNNKGQRRNFIWLAFVCLSQESALGVLKCTLLADERDENAKYAQEEWDKVADATNALAKEKREFEEERTQLHSEIERLEADVALLKEAVGKEREARYTAAIERDNLTYEVAKYRQVVDGLRILKELLT